MASYYDLLEVAPDADQATIKRAYRRLAKAHHPDVNSDPAAQMTFKDVSTAYEVLSDPKKRREYDRLTGGGANPRLGFTAKQQDLGDALQDLMDRVGPTSKTGFGFSPPSKTKLQAAITVGLQDLVEGRVQKIKAPDGTEHLMVIPVGTKPGTVIEKELPGAIVALTVNCLPHPWLTMESEQLVATVPLTLSEYVKGATFKLPIFGREVDVAFTPGADPVFIPKAYNDWPLLAQARMVLPEDLSPQAVEKLDSFLSALPEEPDPRSWLD